MTDFIPKAPTQKIGGLGPKAARLQALREKAAKQKDSAQSTHADTNSSAKATNAPARKTAFQRKAT